MAKQNDEFKKAWPSRVFYGYTIMTWPCFRSLMERRFGISQSHLYPTLSPVLFDFGFFHSNSVFAWYYIFLLYMSNQFWNCVVKPCEKLNLAKTQVLEGCMIAKIFEVRNKVSLQQQLVMTVLRTNWTCQRSFLYFDCHFIAQLIESNHLDFFVGDNVLSIVIFSS